MKREDGRSKQTVRALEPNLGCPGSVNRASIPNIYIAGTESAGTIEIAANKLKLNSQKR